MTDLYRYYDPDTRTIVRMDGKAAGGTIGDDNATVLHFEYPKGFMDTRIAYLVFNVKDDAGNYLYYTPLTTPPFDGYSFAIPAAVMSKVRKNNLSYGLGFVQGANNNQGGGLPDHLAVENSIAQNLIIGTFPPKPSEIAVGPDTPIPTDIIPTYPAPIGIPNPTDRAWIEYLLHNALMGVSYDATLDKFVFTSYSGNVWDVSVAETIPADEVRYAPGVNLRQKLDEMDATDVSLMDGKVDKIAGKGLSANDFTNENLARLNSTASIEELAAEHTLIVATDGKINTHIADLANPHAVTKAQVGLGNADNTSDANKPVSILQQAALDGKVDKMANFGLSSNDYTSAEKVKLAGIAPGAEVNVNADWNATDGDALIFNKPTLGTAAARNVGTAPGEVPVIAGNGKLSDSIIPSLAIGEYVGEVTSRANLTTLTTAQQGDIAKVSGDSDVNNNGVWFLNGTYSTPVAWIQIVGPGSVISVNGQSGIVNLNADDVGAVPASRTVNNKVLSADITLGPSDVGAVPTTRMVNGKALDDDVELDYTDVGAVPDTRKVNNKALSADVILTPADVGAVPPERTVNQKALSADVVLTPADIGAVPPERTVNNKALSADIVLSPADVGAVPTTRKVNNKALSSDISLGASDVGAVPTTRKVNNKALSADISLTPADIGAVPPERTVNGYSLSSDVVLSPADVGAVPTTRKVNDKTLSSDVTLDASDVGAVPVTRKISGNALSQDINLVAADITDGILDIARLPTGNAADKVPKLSAAATEGQSLRARSDGTFEPFTPSTSPMAMYTGNITGDGSTKVFLLNHGLTRTPMVTLTDGNGRTVHTTTVTDASTVTVTFHTAPAQGIKYTVRAIA